MSDLRIVAKAMNDLADDWHWLVLRDAEQVEPRRYAVSSAHTACGLLVVDEPRIVRLYDMGAPAEPTCERCREGESPALRQAREVVEAAVAGAEIPEAIPASSLAGAGAGAVAAGRRTLARSGGAAT